MATRIVRCTLLLCVAGLTLACKAKPSDTEACLDRPGELMRPPVKGLPCDLLPPRKAPN